MRYSEYNANEYLATRAPARIMLRNAESPSLWLCLGVILCAASPMILYWLVSL